MEQPRNSRIAEDRCGVVVGAARVEGMLQVEAPVVDRDVGARARVPDPAEATCRPAVTGIADAEAQCGVDDEAAGLKGVAKAIGHVKNARAVITGKTSRRASR